MTSKECIDPAVFIPFSEENPRRSWDPPGATGTWRQCRNLYTSYDGFDGERWKCDICGKSYFLDYEDMK
jgi:hypothetical protein